MGVVYMFIGRERELASLRQLYNSDKFEFVVLYGRRRVGKTALINYFIDGKKAGQRMFFAPVESIERIMFRTGGRRLSKLRSGSLYRGLQQQPVSFPLLW